MGAARQKRRKRLARAWAALQEKHGLSESDMKLAREVGILPDRLEQALADPASGSPSAAERIGQFHRRWQERLVARRAAIEAGLEIPKKKRKAASLDPMWAKAKQLCRLNEEDLRRAKELGLNPRSLLKNIPGPSQRWKAPVGVWIRALYEGRQQRSKREPRPTGRPGAP